MRPCPLSVVLEYLEAGEHLFRLVRKNVSDENLDQRPNSGLVVLLDEGLDRYVLRYPVGE